MSRFAFLTLEDRTQFVIDDEHAIQELRSLGDEVVELPWKEAAHQDLSGFDAVVVRTTWDYTAQLPDFLEALSSMEKNGARLHNALPMIRWNADKTYLRDLVRWGVRIVPSQFGPGLDRKRLQELADDVRLLGVDEWILKPTVSANANDTFRLSTSLSSGELEGVLSVFRQRPWIAQPFLRSVTAEGEYSLHYFGGHYSHTVLKTPKRGDFRVQEEHGGYVRKVEPNELIRRAGDDVMRALNAHLSEVGVLRAGPPLQARVDLVRFGDRFVVMELELIEPSLYFRCDPPAASRFAQVLKALAQP